jgi:DNA-binding LytR/AlgR family response regulator
MRIHRSHLVAIDKVRSLRKSGDGAVVEVGEPTIRVIPVSRNHYAALKSRLGLRRTIRSHALQEQPT